jgi:hypothetical protein
MTERSSGVRLLSSTTDERLEHRVCCCNFFILVFYKTFFINRFQGKKFTSETKHRTLG